MLAITDIFGPSSTPLCMPLEMLSGYRGTASMVPIYVVVMMMMTESKLQLPPSSAMLAFHSAAAAITAAAALYPFSSFTHINSCDTMGILQGDVFIVHVHNVPPPPD
jgi:hypothetical protein